MFPLRRLPVNKTEYFHCPLGKDDKYVRTGTIADGSCCIHSLLHAYSPEYVTQNETERSETVVQIRKNISKILSRRDWEHLGDSVIALLAFQDQFTSIIKQWFSSPSQSELVTYMQNSHQMSPKSIDILQAITSEINEEDFTKKVIEPAYTWASSKNMTACKDRIVFNGLFYIHQRLIKTGLPQPDIENFEKIFAEFLHIFTTYAEDIAFQNYKKELENLHSPVDQCQLGLLSDRFNRDIYFIDSKTKMPYMMGGSADYKNRISNIILWVDNDHYEILGRVVPGTMKVQREFLPSDPFIRTLYTFLFDRKEFMKNHAEFLPFLPREIRDQFDALSSSMITSEQPEKNNPQKLSQEVVEKKECKKHKHQSSTIAERKKNRPYGNRKKLSRSLNTK